ncbi:hypothetical protein E2C01_024508 [Portunus trituberculatus]|uniref:Uncharacterized protein n=1 Tax=Portunus trituberculatus TaxID=210409 RepID=A0A5B7EEX5_PORTR|nr:hypothetical protein [Portunus trituberculatus]
MVDIADGEKSGRRRRTNNLKKRRSRVKEEEKKKKIAFGPSASTGPVIANETSAAIRVTYRREREKERERKGVEEKSDPRIKAEAVANERQRLFLEQQLQQFSRSEKQGGQPPHPPEQSCARMRRFRATPLDLRLVSSLTPLPRFDNRL